MTTTVIRANSAASFLALVPTLTGADPKGNLMVIPFSGNRTMGAMRFDLDPIPAHRAEVARVVLGHLCNLDLCDAVVIVGYPTDHEEAARALVKEVGDTVESAGFALRDALVVGVEHFWSALDADPELHRITEIEAEAERLGVSLAAPAYDDTTGLREEAGQPLDVPHIRALMRQIEAGQEFWSEHYDDALLAVRRGQATNLDVARIGHGLLEYDTRDRIIPTVGTGILGLDHVAVMAFMTGRSDGEVDFDALKQGRAIMLTIADACEDDERESQALTLAAWFDWALGRGSRAHSMLVKAIEIDGETNTFAPLLDRLFSSGAVPAWAYSTADKHAQ